MTLKTSFLGNHRSKKHVVSSRLFTSPDNEGTEGSSQSMPNSSSYEKASAAFEAAHAEDPRSATTQQEGDESLPYSVHYHRRMA
eukprot:CAMPEP_0178669772 /NCGR_PEP_ID=MMETSP0698-20121128/32304_1 /TAXON_ID=265572 /ORGANISM="Extubocellulus spinifer, Strain CCMP396" /LENGTH=83 /DNA_ID=CAMNT_0020313453 /DNA_START=63 /DNA_END=311 /DNA_ORIENTATION=-